MSPHASHPSTSQSNSPASSARASQTGTGRILLLEGQSGRLTLLRRWLARLGADGGDADLESLEDLGDLFESRLRSAENVTLFVDTADLPLEEIGLLKRWIGRVNGARLILVGSPAESEGAQRLWDESQLLESAADEAGRSEATEWLPWPPDILRLETLLQKAIPQADAWSPGTPESASDVAARQDRPRGGRSEFPTRRTGISPTRIERGAETSAKNPSAKNQSPDSIDAELAELREIEFILGRPGPQSVAETPNLAQSPVAPADSIEEPSEEPGERLGDEPFSEEPFDEESQASPQSLDPLAIALEAAARRSSHSSPSERDEDEERVANFLRGLDLDAVPLPPADEVADLDLAIEEDREGSAQKNATPSKVPAPWFKDQAPWFKDQVADLADIAQRIELGLSAARSADFEATLHTAFPSATASGQDSSQDETAAAEQTQEPNISERKLSVRLDELELEVLRLSQFTRTLGFLAAPPAQGSQRLDLRSLVSEWVQTQAAQAGGTGFENGRSEGAPRFLLRVDEELQILSDKSLLSQAFDALFYVARRATPPGQAIRVRVHRIAVSPGPALSETSIEFERGLLADRTPEEICRPYALRRILPELGPNALRAARSIIEGQGGGVVLEDVGAGRMAWRIQLAVSN